MNILLTGHLGYVGSVLAPALVKSGHQVTGLDAGWYDGAFLYQPSTLLRHCLKADIRDIDASVFDRIDAVIHLAGLSNDPLGRLNPGLTDEINHLAAVRLAALAKTAGVRRFVTASSCSIYGAAGDDWIDENSAPAPVTEYARSKLAMENGILALADSDFEVVIVRPGTVFGESPALRFDLVVNNLVAWAMDTKRIRFKSDGTAWRPLLYVEDLAEAFIFLAEAPAAVVAGQAFNIGFNEQNYRVGDLGHIIQSLIPGARVEFAVSDTDSRSYRVDCNRLARIWTPVSGRISVHEGVRRLVACLRQYPVGADQFEGSRHQRVAHLESAMSQGWLDDGLRVISKQLQYV